MSVDWQDLPPARELSERRREAEAVGLGALANQHRRPLTALGVAVGSAVALTGAAGAYAAFAPVEDTRMIRCFTSADLGGDAIYLSEAAPEGHQGGMPEIDNPVQACANMWMQGLLVAGAEDAQPPTPDANLPVPPLTACVLDDTDAGPIVGVLPGGTDVCNQVGLPRWQP